MFKSNRAIWAVIVCFTLLGAAACGDDPAPAAPTPTPTPTPTPEPEPVTITGNWHGHVHGNLIDGEAHVHLEQTDMDVTGDWHMDMPAALVELGAPANLELEGAVEGMVEGSTADLEFTFLEAFHDYLGHDCGIHVHVEEFTEDDLEGTWHTEDTCPAHVVDEGTLDMHKD